MQICWHTKRNLVGQTYRTYFECWDELDSESLGFRVWVHLAADRVCDDLLIECFLPSFRCCLWVKMITEMPHSSRQVLSIKTFLFQSSLDRQKSSARITGELELSFKVGLNSLMNFYQQRKALQSFASSRRRLFVVVSLQYFAAWLLVEFTLQKDAQAREPHSHCYSRYRAKCEFWSHSRHVLDL